MIATTSMPAIDAGALFIGREEQEGNDGSGVTMEDDADADAEAVEYVREYLEVAQPTLGGAFWEEDHNGEDDGDK